MTASYSSSLKASCSTPPKSRATSPRKEVISSPRKEAISSARKEGFEQVPSSEEQGAEACAAAAHARTALEPATLEGEAEGSIDTLEAAHTSTLAGRPRWVRASASRNGLLLVGDRIREFKKMGHAAVKSFKWQDAITHYTDALKLCTGSVNQGGDGVVQLLYANRSAAYAGCRQFAEALADADHCISIENSGSLRPHTLAV
jgi:hypothetical protein